MLNMRILITFLIIFFITSISFSQETEGYSKKNLDETLYLSPKVEEIPIEDPKLVPVIDNDQNIQIENKNIDDLKILSKKEKRAKKLEKRIVKRIRKLKNPNWVYYRKGIEGPNAYFRSDLSGMPKRSNLNTNFDTAIGTQDGNFVFLNKASSGGTENISKKVIQIALFLPHIMEVEIHVNTICGSQEGFSSKDQTIPIYRSFSSIYLNFRDLQDVRQTNTIERFLKDDFGYTRSVLQKILNARLDLCN